MEFVSQSLKFPAERLVFTLQPVEPFHDLLQFRIGLCRSHDRSRQNHHQARHKHTRRHAEFLQSVVTARRTLASRDEPVPYANHSHKMARYVGIDF